MISKGIHCDTQRPVDPAKAIYRKRIITVGNKEEMHRSRAGYAVESVEEAKIGGGSGTPAWGSREGGEGLALDSSEYPANARRLRARRRRGGRRHRQNRRPRAPVWGPQKPERR